jgi:hypothetical protein
MITGMRELTIDPCTLEYGGPTGMHTRRYVYPLDDHPRTSGIVLARRWAAKQLLLCTYTEKAFCMQQRHLGKVTASFTLGS